MKKMIGIIAGVLVVLIVAALFVGVKIAGKGKTDVMPCYVNVWWKGDVQPTIIDNAQAVYSYKDDVLKVVYEDKGQEAEKIINLKDVHQCSYPVKIEKSLTGN